MKNKEVKSYITFIEACKILGKSEGFCLDISKKYLHPREG